jgi:hypothetical protein
MQRITNFILPGASDADRVRAEQMPQVTDVGLGSVDVEQGTPGILAGMESGLTPAPVGPTLADQMAGGSGVLGPQDLPPQTMVPEEQRAPVPVLSEDPEEQQRAVEKQRLFEDEKFQAKVDFALREAGITNEEDKQRWFNSFTTSFTEAALPTAVMKVADQIPGVDIEEKVDALRQMEKDGVIDRRGFVDLAGTITGMGFDIAATRYLTGLGSASARLQAATKTKGAARGVRAAEGALEGLLADAYRAGTMEEEDIRHVGLGTGIGAAVGAVLPGGRAVREAVETVAEEVAPKATRRVAAIEMNDGTFREFPNAKGHADDPEMTKFLSENVDDVSGRRGFVEDGEFKQASGTVDEPVYIPDARQADRRVTEAPVETERRVGGRRTQDRPQAEPGRQTAEDRAKKTDKQLEDRRRARTDELTGIGNRSSFEKAKPNIDARGDMETSRR